MRNLDFRGVWSRPRWANPKLTFVQCGTSSRTHLADYLRCENGKRLCRRNVSPTSNRCSICLTILRCDGSFSPGYHFITVSYPFLHRWTPWTFWSSIMHIRRQLLYYVSPHSPGSILSSASHGQRPHLAYQTITLSDQSIFLRYGYFTVSSSTGMDTSIYYTSSTGHPTIRFETYATIGSQKSVFQHLGTQGRRQPLYGNIWQPFPDLQSDLSRLRPQSLRFGLENRGDRYHFTKMVDTPSSHRLLHDDRYGPRSPDAWRSSSLAVGHLELVLSFLEDSPTPRCLHISRMLTSCADTTSRSTWYRLCCTNSSDSSRASFRYGNEIYKNCSLNLETHGYQPRKAMKTGALLAIFVLFRRKSLSPIFYLLLPGSWSVTTVTSSSCDSSQTFVCTAIPASFRLQIAFELIFIYLFLHYMAHHTADGPPRTLPTPYSMSLTNTIGPSLQSDDPTSASYIPRAARMIPTSTTVHTIFIKKISYLFTSRPDELWILERTEDGRETWKPVETFLENMHLTRDRATLRTTANQWRQYYDIPVHSSSPSTATPFPVLPHPEHTNVHVSQPFEAIPDQLHILQSCCGRSAEHHSQGTTTSLFWPPWRSTPPSSPSVTLHRTLHPNTPTTPLHHPHRPVPPDELGPMDMSDSSV